MSEKSNMITDNLYTILPVVFVVCCLIGYWFMFPQDPTPTSNNMNTTEATVESVQTISTPASGTAENTNAEIGTTPN